jgi:hypothetical protein
MRAATGGSNGGSSGSNGGHGSSSDVGRVGGQISQQYLQGDQQRYVVVAGMYVGFASRFLCSLLLLLIPAAVTVADYRSSGECVWGLLPHNVRSVVSHLYPTCQACAIDS